MTSIKNVRIRLFKNTNFLKQIFLGMILIMPILSFFGLTDSRISAQDTGGPQPISGTIHIGEVEITYIGNAGFLFVYNDRKIIIDALYSSATVPTGVSLAVFGKIQKGLPPFDGVDLALATHSHNDHYDSYSVGTFLKNNPDVIFISSNEVRYYLEMEYSGFNSIQDRVVAVTLEKGETCELTENGIKLKILGMRHGGYYSGKNYGYLFEMGDVKILHMGDSLLTQSEIEVFQLPQEEIDVVFVNWWYLINSEYANTVREGIKAKQIVVMHNDIKTFEDRIVDIDWILERVGAEFPDALVFYEVPKETVEEPSVTSSEEEVVEEPSEEAVEEEPSGEISSEEARIEGYGYFLIIPVLIIGAVTVIILLKKRQKQGS